MKFTLIPVLIAALSASTALAVNSCGEENSRWTVEVSGVTDVPGICGGLWDNMKRFASCAILEGTSCEDFTGDGDLLWGFTVVSADCNAGCVESAWWEATKNKLGAISCS